MSGGRKKVLWVDDEIEFLRSHILFLETRGYCVTPVFSGDDAIHLIEQNPREFDLVLLDERMPGKDGISTFEEIKQINPDLPVVMVTKNEEEHVMESALGRKIDAYLTKPVNPSQILLVCKRLLESRRILSNQISQKFIRSYSENRTALGGYQSCKDWIKIYDSLVYWDLELDKIDDEGLRQTHAGQKSDSNAVFSDYLVENYVSWLKGERNPPVLGHEALQKIVLENQDQFKTTFLFVLSGMRYDQYIIMERILRQFSNVQKNNFFSNIPTASVFSRISLLSGALPAEISEKEKNIWKTGNEDQMQTSVFEKKVLSSLLTVNKIKINNNEPWFLYLSDSVDSNQIIHQIDKCKKSKVVVCVVDFFDFLSHNQPQKGVLKELIRDESGIRTLTNSWFERSAVLKIMKDLISKDYRLIITSDHGNVLCSRSTELYRVQDWSKNLRYKFGSDISSDERRALFIQNPVNFGLPGTIQDKSCFIAKENYYFVPPEKNEQYKTQFRNSFQHGGISMEEIIMPLGIFTR